MIEEEDSNSIERSNSMTEELKNEYMDAFNMFDTNHDGTITPQKLGD